MRTPSKTEVPVTGDFGTSPSTSNFQFSTRDLLIATAVISVVLAIGVPFGGFAIVAVVIGLLQAIILMAGDWLIRPENRRALAFTTTISWITLGIGLIILAINMVMQAIDNDANPFAWQVMEGSLVVGAGGAFLMARRRWRQLGDHSRENL
jgi:uncharacterized membrane protein HdeD (DUF308 family)